MMHRTRTFGLTHPSTFHPETSYTWYHLLMVARGFWDAQGEADSWMSQCFVPSLAPMSDSLKRAPT